MSYLKVSNLEKRYRSHWTYLTKSGGLSNVTFEINKGESFALLGGNGAGKTTTIKCILGLIKRYSGQILFKDKNFEDRSSLGFLPEQPYFYQHLSVKETLEFYAGLFFMQKSEKIKAVDRVIERLNLGEFKKRQVKSLSKGQQQRVGIAQAIINDPEFLILDEPFSGLDPLARVDIKLLFRELHQDGKTLMISSHVLSDIEELCDRAVILKQGISKREVIIKDLHQANAEEIIYRILITGKTQEDLTPLINDNKIETNKISEISEGVSEFELKGQTQAEAALHLLIHSGASILDFSKRQRSLEDVFVEVNRET